MLQRKIVRFRASDT